MKKALFVLLILFVVLVAVVSVRTATFTSRQPDVAPAPPETISEEAATHLASAIAIPTISYENGDQLDSAAFYRFREFLLATYPLSDSLLEVTYINDLSLVLHWKGTNPALPPVIVMGHMDVVPVPGENLEKWTHPPFDGVIADDIIWGRGAMDNKVNVIGLMEAAEHLLRQGHQPRRSVYFCFGHDEEVGGLRGAKAIVEYLKEQQVQPSFVLDEGGIISDGIIPGLSAPAALIGTGEKGYVTLHLRVEMDGGHSSSPENESAIDVMSQAIVRLKENPFPAEISPPVEDFMNILGPQMSIENRIPLANRWLFEPVILYLFGASGGGNAMIRTTTAPTIIKAGVKDNIIPAQAEATVNFRTLPGVKPDEVEARVREIIDDDRIAIRHGMFNTDAPPASPTDSEHYELLATTIKQVFPECIISPSLLSGATDSRHYVPLTSNIYRFTPIRVDTTNMNTVHGIDERLKVSDFNNAIRYYILLLRKVTSDEPEHVP